MTVAQFDLFQETYHLTEDDVMYIPQEARVSIWQSNPFQNAVGRNTKK